MSYQGHGGVQGKGGKGRRECGPYLLSAYHTYMVLAQLVSLSVGCGFVFCRYLQYSSLSLGK